VCCTGDLTSTSFLGLAIRVFFVCVFSTAIAAASIAKKRPNFFRAPPAPLIVR
jgi:hypothetical protein